MNANGEADIAYRALFEANPQPMWVFERSSLRFLAVNDAALRQYGYSREEFLALTILDIRPAEDATAAASSVERYPSAPKIWRHRRKDSSTLLAEVTAHSMEFMGVEARLVLAIDVTARERSAELLRRTNRTLEAVLEAAPVGVLVFNPNGEIVETNETARRQLGHMGLEPIAEIMTAVLRGEWPGTSEVEVTDGRWVEVSGQAVEIGPGSNGAVLVLTEITQRRAEQGRLSEDVLLLEERVRQRTAALQESAEELEGFCFSVSHDLRGPLRAIDGFAQVVLSDSEARLSAENRDALERVRRAGRRMGELIDGILILSRVSRSEFGLCPLDLTAIASRSAESQRRAHPERSLRFVIEPNLTAVGDPHLVASLIDRLFENSVKFTQGREEATIELFADGNGWVVRDDGVGFDASYAARLFRPFERLHSTKEFAGNGLGLAVAARIVRRHGGTISGDSSPGEGAAFRFSLGVPKMA